MRLRFWTILYFIFWSMVCYSQQDKNNFSKNEISIIVGTGLTKTNIDLIKNLPGVFGSIKDNPLIKPIWGNDIGIEYTRNISKTYGITIGGRHAQKGQQSINIFSSRYPNKDSLDILRTSGGFSHKLLLSSSELVLRINKRIFKHNDIGARVSIGTSIDYIDRMKLVKYSIGLLEGTKERGCCSRTYSEVAGNYLDRLSANIKRNYFRLGGSISGELQYKLITALNLRLRVEAQLLSGILKKDALIESNFLPSGTVSLIRFQGGINYNF